MTPTTTPQQPPQAQAQPQHAGVGQGPLPQYTSTGAGAGPTPPNQTSSLQPHPIGMPRTQPPSYPQGPLAYLEQTTSNIGMPDRR